MKNFLKYFTPFEWILWGVSVLVITLAFCLAGDFQPLTLCASLIGVTSLIFIAKGNVLGQFLIILFALLYAGVSYRQRYYGEMITYLGMSLPSAVVACVTWLKNPSKKGKSEVQIADMSGKKWLFLAVFAVGVTTAFYFILKAFDTNRLYLSTLSVTTSIIPATLLILRNPYYAVGYACNDLVLIGLWTYSCFSSLSYLPMLVCFIAFFVNDLYGFYNWKRIRKRQR